MIPLKKKLSGKNKMETLNDFDTLSVKNELNSPHKMTFIPKTCLLLLLFFFFLNFLRSFMTGNIKWTSNISGNVESVNMDFLHLSRGL